MGIKILFYIFFIISLSNSAISKSDNNKKPSGLTLNLIHRDSFESNNLTRIEKFRKIVHRSKLRANHLMSYSTASESELPTYHLPGIIFESSNFVVNLSVGTPPSGDNQYLILDTGAELTWLQCDGCIDCFKQKQRLYNPHESDTYEILPCDNHLCNAYDCNHDHCKFKEWDSEDVHVEGFMSIDSFHFPSDHAGDDGDEGEDDATTVDKVVFGCAYGTVGFDFQNNPDNNINGIFGLAPGPRSFVSQFAPDQKVFGYCLADWHFGPPEHSGQLLFGEDALLPVSAHVQITPIVEKDTRHYFLKLMDIEIIAPEGMNYTKRFGFEAGTFDRVHDLNKSSGGFVIDSGTSMTYLAADVYTLVRQEFVEYMTKRLYLNERGASDIDMDLCWDMPNGVPDGLPSVILHFQNNEYPDDPAQSSELILDRFSLFHIEEKENPHLCLGILGYSNDVTVEDPNLNILGAKQQTGNKFSFSFDGPKSTLSWLTWDCGLTPT